MAKRAAVAFNDVHRFMDYLFARDVHAKRVYSLASATLGVISSASLHRVAIRSTRRCTARISTRRTTTTTVLITRSLPNYILSIYYVNKETLLIDKVTGTLNIGGMSMTFLTQYYEYKKVAGVMMAHREVKYAGDVNTAIVILRSTYFTTAAYI